MLLNHQRMYFISPHKNTYKPQLWLPDLQVTRTDGAPLARGSTGTVQEDGSVLKKQSAETERGMGEAWEGFGTEPTYLKICECLTPGGCCGNQGELGPRRHCLSGLSDLLSTIQETWSRVWV